MTTDDLLTECLELGAGHDVFRAENAKLRQLLTEAQEVVEFYANEDNWKEQIMDGMDYYARWMEIQEDEPGDKARALLAKLDTDSTP